MNEEVMNKYQKYLRGKYRKKNTRYGYYEYAKLFLQHTNKSIEEINYDDLEKWHGYITEKYKVNGNMKRIQSVNYLFRWLGKEDMTLPIPRHQETNKIVLDQEELDKYLEASKTDPLEHLIALFQIDGLLRPSEFANLKISNIDRKKMVFYLDDTKTGNNHIIMSPRLHDAIDSYLPYRKPKPEYKDYLIIMPKGRYKGMPPNERGEFVRNHTKQIAVRADIEKYVTPYIIKPSSITCDFENKINPKIIKRKARHKRIETTLRYDHTDDDMVRRHFEERDLNIDNITYNDKQRVLFNRYIQGEIDINTLKQGLETLEVKINEKNNQHIGYA
jgi:site-specific recombinase XerD